MYILLTFIVDAIIITKINFLIVNSFFDSFDDFVDDLLVSEVDLLKCELDFLIIQHLFNSIDLKVFKRDEFRDDDSLAA